MDAWMSEARELAARQPRKILFLCVQNSARSQLAHAIAHHLAPQGVSVLSAGSAPSAVRPQALAVLEEAGISTLGLVAKSVAQIDPAGVDAVITLCAEEVCPVFLGQAWQVHWGLPDPAQTEPEAAKLAAFRATRDELLHRLRFLFSLMQDVSK